MFKTLILTALLPCLSGGTIQNQPFHLSKNSENDEITLTAEESSKPLFNFYNDFLEGNYTYVTLRYLNHVHTFSEFSDGVYYYNFDDSDNYSSIGFVVDNDLYGGPTTYNYYFIDSNNVTLLDNDLVIVFDESVISEQVFNTAYEALQQDLPSNPPYTNILQEIITILVSGITGIATGLGNGVSNLVSSIFITEGNLSVFGGVIVVFAGLGLAVGLSRWVMNFLTSLGKKD